MNTRVYISSTKSLENTEKFSYLYKTVPIYRQKKIDKYKTDKEKRLSLLSGLLLSKALKEENIDDKNLIICTKDNGRPYFKDHEDIYFSISHSEERAMCVLSDKPVGCDVEIIIENSDIDLETWPNFESYSKASDTNIMDLLNAKVTFNKSYHFKEVNLNDGYKYVICSLQQIEDDQIQFVEF